MADLARLGFQVDSSPIVQAKANIDAMGAAGVKAATDLAAAQNKITASAKLVAVAEQQVAQETAKTAAEQSKAAVAATGEQVAQTKLATTLKQLEQAEARAAAEVARMTAAQAQAQAQIARTNQALANMAAQQRQTNEQLQALNAQFAALRGPIDQVRTAFALFMGALGINALVDTTTQLQRVEATLRFVTGSTDGTKKAFADFEKGADMLGVGVLETAPAFAQFAAASKVTGLSLEQARTTFEGVSAAMMVMGRSTTDVQGALFALQQILSKNKVMAEEVRLQFGERLPGGLALAAAAMGMTSQQFNKAMEAGTLDAKDFVTKVGSYLRDQFAPQMAGTTDMAARNLAELENAWLKLQTVVISGGFGEAMISTLNQLTAVLQSGPMVAAAQALGGAFAFVAKNLDLLSVAAAGFIGLKLVNVIRELSATATVANAIGIVADSIALIGVRATASVFGVQALTMAMRALSSTTGIGLALTAAAVAFTALNRETDYATEGTDLYSRSLEQANTLLGYVPAKADAAKAAIEGLKDTQLAAGRALAQAALDEARRNLPGAQRQVSSIVAPLAGDVRAIVGGYRSSGIQAPAVFNDANDFLQRIVHEGPQSVEDMQRLFNVVAQVRKEYENLGQDTSGIEAVNKALIEGNKGFETQYNGIKNNTEILDRYDSKIQQVTSGLVGMWNAQRRMEEGRQGGPGAMGDIQAGINAAAAAAMAQAEGAAAALGSGGVEALTKYNEQQKILTDGAKEAERIFKAYQASIGITGTQAQTLAEATSGTNVQLRLAAQAAQLAGTRIAGLNGEVDRNVKLEGQAKELRAQATGGLSALNERLREAQTLLAAGKITTAEFAAAVNAINSDGLDRYRSALKDHQTEVANAIKLQLIANATMSDGLANLGRTFNAMLGTVETAMSSLIQKGVQAGGILAIVANAAQGAIDWAQSKLPGGAVQTTNLDKLQAELDKITAEVNKPKKDPNASAERSYENEKRKLEEQIAAQGRLNDAYGQGAAAVRAVEAENERLAAITELHSKKYTPDQIKALTALTDQLFKAKTASDALRASMETRAGIGREVEDAQLAIRMVGATEQQVTVEQRLVEIRRQYQALGMSQDAATQEAEKFRGSIEGLEETKRVAKQLQDTFDGVGDAFGQFLDDLTSGTADATESLEGLLNSLYQIAKSELLQPALKQGFGWLGKQALGALGIDTGSLTPDVPGMGDTATITATTAVINATTVTGGIPNRPDSVLDGLAGGLGSDKVKGGAGADTLEGAQTKLADTATGFTSTFGKILGWIGQGAQAAGQGFLGLFGSALSSIVNGLSGGSGGGILGSIGNLIGGLIGMGGGGSVVGSASSPYIGSADAAFYHGGGIVGSGGRRGRVAMSAFNGAPRFHGGGIVGVANDEVAAILKRREEVITEADPRHTFNMARGGAAAPIRPAYNFQVITPPGHEVTARQETPNASGGTDVRVEIGKAVAGEMNRRGSPVQKSLSQNYLAEPTIRMR